MELKVPRGAGMSHGSPGSVENRKGSEAFSERDIGVFAPALATLGDQGVSMR